MPPLRKIDRNRIIETAMNILNDEGMDAINARRIASVLNISVQPIFYNFKNMDELKDEVKSRIYDIYQSYMNNGKNHVKPYKGMGLAYIKFARDYPNYFKEIFMNKTDLTPSSFIGKDDVSNDVIKVGSDLTGFSEEEQREFHFKVWVFTHGLASIVASSTVTISDEAIDSLLDDAVKSMIIGKKVLDNEKHN